MNASTYVEQLCSLLSIFVLLFLVFQGYSVRMDISGGNLGTFSKAEIARELLRCGFVNSVHKGLLGVGGGDMSESQRSRLI